MGIILLEEEFDMRVTMRPLLRPVKGEPKQKPPSSQLEIDGRSKGWEQSSNTTNARMARLLEKQS